MMSIVEEPTVPQFVTAFATLVEVQVVGAVKVVESVQNVFAGVRMDNIQENGEAHAMGSVNELFELLWSTVS